MAPKSLVPLLLIALSRAAAGLTWAAELFPTQNCLQLGDGNTREFVIVDLDYEGCVRLQPRVASYVPQGPPINEFASVLFFSDLNCTTSTDSNSEWTVFEGASNRCLPYGSQMGSYSVEIQTPSDKVRRGVEARAANEGEIAVRRSGSLAAAPAVGRGVAVDLAPSDHHHRLVTRADTTAVWRPGQRIFFNIQGIKYLVDNIAYLHSSLTLTGGIISNGISLIVPNWGTTLDPNGDDRGIGLISLGGQGSYSYHITDQNDDLQQASGFSVISDFAIREILNDLARFVGTTFEESTAIEFTIQNFQFNTNEKLTSTVFNGIL